MSWETWGPAILSSGVVAIAGLFGGYFLKAFVEKGVQHGFDRQLEHLGAELRLKEKDIESLRNGALANMAARHEELDRRQIKAAENLWAATVFQRRYHVLTSFIRILNIPEIDKSLKKSDADKEKIMLFAKTAWDISRIDKITEDQRPRAEVERLFVPPKAWIAYQALSITVSQAVAVAGALKAGLGTKFLKDSHQTASLIKSVLPHQSELLEEHPDTAPYYLQKELEEIIFVELKTAFSSSDQFRKTVEDASEILKHAQENSSANLSIDVPDNLRVEPLEVS